MANCTSGTCGESDSLGVGGSPGATRPGWFGTGRFCVLGQRGKGPTKLGGGTEIGVRKRERIQDFEGRRPTQLTGGVLGDRPRKWKQSHWRTRDGTVVGREWTFQKKM